MAEAYQYSPYDMHVQVVWHNQPISSWSYPCTKIEKPIFIPSQCSLIPALQCALCCYYFHVIYLQHYLSSISQLPQQNQKSHNNMPRSTSGRRSGGSGRRSGGSRRGKLSTRRSTLLNYFFGRRDEEDEIPLTDLHNRTKEDLMGLMKGEDGQYNPEGMENVADDLLVAIDENKRLNAEITELNSANEDLVVTNTSLLDTITKNAKLSKSKRMAVLGFVVVLAGKFECLYKRNFPVLDIHYETRANPKTKTVIFLSMYLLSQRWA